MKRYFPRNLRRFLCSYGAGGVVLLLTPGCGSKQETQTVGQTTGANGTADVAQSANAPDADLRKSFSQKNFDINKVPPEQRERVRAMMQQNATTGASATTSPGK